MTTRTLIKEFLGAALLASVIFSPGAVTMAQAPPSPANLLKALPQAIRATPGCLGVELAQTESGKQVIFAWFENKKAALNWYYSQPHQMLVKMGGGANRPRGPLADVPDDGKPIMAVASVVLARPQDGIAQQGLPPVSQIAIELYQPMKGGLFLGGRFAPAGLKVPNLRDYSPKEKK